MLSELLEEYKESIEEQKLEKIKEFTTLLWGSKYYFKTYKKYFTYKVNEDLLNQRNDLIELFSKYQIIEYDICRSFYDTKLIPSDYIRIHVNNMYGYLTSENVYLSKEYYQLLLTPKHEYFSVVDKIKNSENVNVQEIEDKIINAFNEAEIIRNKCNAKKLNMKWSDYKNLINTYIARLFNNYIPLHEYEEKNGWEMNVNIDGWSEDNYIVKYFCKSLTGYMRNYVKSLNQKDKECYLCGIKIITKSNRQKYCEMCKIKVIRNQTRLRVNKFRNVTL